MENSEISEISESLPNQLMTPDELTRLEEPGYELQQLKDFKENKLTIPRSTGFNKLDSVLLGGVRGGDLMIVSGISGRGKTLLTLQMVKNMSDRGIPTALFTYEEPISKIKWRLKEMGAADDIICFAPKKLKSGNVGWLEEKIVDGITNFLIKVFVIDNLDFLTAEKTFNQDDKWSMQSRIIAMLKRVAIENSVAIILNAHVKKVDESIPSMENLYGSGDVYKLADFVVFIHRLRGEPLGDSTQRKGLSNILPFSNISKIIVDKNRLTGELINFDVEYKDGVLKEIFYETVNKS